MSRLPPGPRNLWALTVLCLLRQRPMHPYEIQRLIRERKKEDFLDLKRGSLYHAIARLQQDGFIESIETTREGRRPERTIYRLTEDGEKELLTRLRELLAKPARDSSPFFAAVSFLAHLAPNDVVERLESRVQVLEEEIAGIDAAVSDLLPRIGRLVLLEAEYARAMREAELRWVQSVIAVIRAERLTWDPRALLENRA